MAELIPKGIKNIWKEYRYALLVFLAGLALMLLPSGKEEAVHQAPVQVREEQPDFARELELLLSRVEGAGTVRVLLSASRGEEVFYQEDQDISGDSRRTDTLVLTDGDREEAGLIRRVDPPQYQAALVLCLGADDPAVRLAITQAVANLTGLPTNKVTVLKMEG